MTTRSWQYISSHWDACSITTRPSVTSKETYCHTILEVWSASKCTGSQIDWCTGNWYFLFMYHFAGQKYNAPQVQPGWGSNSWPPDHDSTFHVTEMPALTTRSSVTSDHDSTFHVTETPTLTTRPLVTSTDLNLVWACETKNKKRVFKLTGEFCKMPDTYRGKSV